MPKGRRETTEARYRKVVETFNRLYHQERRRYDDSILETAQETCYEPGHVMKILKKA